MVWGGVLEAGKTELMICEGKVNSHKYCEILENTLIPYVTKHHKKIPPSNRTMLPFIKANTLEITFPLMKLTQ